MPEFRTIFVIYSDRKLLIRANSLFGETMHKGILINLLGMTAPKVAMNRQAGSSNDVTQRENVSHGGAGTQEAQEAQEV